MFFCVRVRVKVVIRPQESTYSFLCHLWLIYEIYPQLFLTFFTNFWERQKLFYVLFVKRNLFFCVRVRVRVIIRPQESTYSFLCHLWLIYEIYPQLFVSSLTNLWERQRLIHVLFFKKKLFFSELGLGLGFSYVHNNLPTGFCVIFD